MRRRRRTLIQADLTRPIIGIENRTAQEVFDIMCDRIRSRPSASIPAEIGKLVRDLKAELSEQQNYGEPIDRSVIERAISALTHPAPTHNDGSGEAVAWHIRWRFVSSAAGSTVLWGQGASPEAAAAEVSRLKAMDNVELVCCTPLYTRPDHTSGEVTEAEPRAFLVHDFHVPRMPVKAQGRFPEPTEYLYPASRADDAKEAAKIMHGTCTPLFAKEVSE